MFARSRNHLSGYRWRDSTWTRARAIASLGMVFGLGAVGTMAYWVDNATMTTGTFSVTSLDLQVNDSKEYTSWTLSGSGMMPGDTKAADLIVQNKGDVEFTYTAKVDASGDPVLAPFMTLSVYSGATLNTGTGKCDGGSQMGSTTLQVNTNKDLVATPRSLNAINGSETLCFQVTLSNAVSKSASNASIKTIVEFTATA